MSNLLGTVLAILGAYIAYQQWRLRRAEYERGLYDKRFEVFSELKRFMEHAVDSGLRYDAIKKFEAVIIEAEFLFEPDVAEYLTVVKQKAEEFNLITFVATSTELYPTESQQEKARQQQAELANYFFGQLREIRRRFAPYLKVHLPRKSLVDRIEGAVLKLP